MIAPYPYKGGKYFLASTIVSRIPRHRIYGEPFFGSGQIFFRKSRSPIEVVNDRDSELVTFFRVCQRHYQELLRCLEFTVISRKQYLDFLATPPDSLTDIQRACRFLYLQRLGYGGLVTGQHYIHRTRVSSRFDSQTLSSVIKGIHHRFDGVQIECQSYEQILSKFDHPDSFFYLDPPYYERTFYKFNFEHTDFVTLARLLKQLRGRFLLSLNDLPEVRTIFSSFHIEQVFNHCGSKNRQMRQVPELLISNYKRPEGE